MTITLHIYTYSLFVIIIIKKRVEFDKVHTLIEKFYFSTESNYVYIQIIDRYTKS